MRRYTIFDTLTPRLISRRYYASLGSRPRSDILSLYRRLIAADAISLLMLADYADMPGRASSAAPDFRSVDDGPLMMNFVMISHAGFIIIDFIIFTASNDSLSAFNK